MMKHLVILLFVFCAVASKADDPIFLPNVPADATGTTVGGKEALDVNVAAGSITATNPSVGSIPSPVPSYATYVGGENPSGDLQGMSLDSLGFLEVDGSGVTQPVSSSQLPASLGQKVSADSLACVLASDQSAIPVTQSGSWMITVSGSITANQGAPGPINSPWPVTLISPNPLPVSQSGSWTVATTAPVNANSNLNARLTVTETESNVQLPNNSVGIIFECESVNADNLRWGFSNSAGDILSATLGILCEPGRSVDYAPVGYGNYIHFISTGGGSDYADVQFVLSQ